jgi:serine/threonine protein kinase
MKRYFKPRVESSSLLSSSKPEWTVKIGDFGLATVSTSSWLQRSNASALHKPTGSILWMAPEIITQRVENPYTQKSDVYSYAVVLYELFSGALPYANKEQNMILFLVGSGRLKLNPKEAVKDDTPQEIIDLIVTCSQYDREQRFDFIRINEILRKIKLINSQIMIQNKSLVRSQSVPNLNTSSKSSDLSDINLSEDYDLSQNEDEEEEEYDDDLMNGMEIINQVSPQSSLVAVASPSTFSQLSQNEFIYE